MAEESVPQWKRELIERRRAQGRAASVGRLQFTCPGVVTAVRQPNLSQGMRFPTTVPDIQHLISQIEADKKIKMGEEKTKKLNSPTEAGKSVDGADDDNLSDSSEEFKYGPGIVSKLKNKYLSLTLRESHAKVRPSLASMRRATSLENILDEDKPEEVKLKFVKNQSSSQNHAAQSRRPVTRNKEYMKRARSVEALMRYNRTTSLDTVKDDVDEESSPLEPEKCRNRLSLEERELPPPDLVKQTLKLFERPGSFPKPPPLMKIASATKSVGHKPLISPKPVTIDKPNNDNKARVANGHMDIRIDTKTRFRTNDLGSPTPDVARHSKDLLKAAVDVEVIEEDSAKISSLEKPVIIIDNDKGKKDDVDASKLKPLITKDWSPISKDRSLDVSDRSPTLPDRNISKERTPEVKERPPFLPDRSSSLSSSIKDQPHFTSPVVDLKKTRESDKSEKILLPSPKPRTLSRVGDKKPVDAPPPPPDSHRAVTVGVLRSPEIPSPGSPMKQVGVIRPIITQKSPPLHHQPKASPKSLTDRELEKNLLNKVKSVEQPVTKVIVSLKQSPEECTVSPTKPQEEKKGLNTSWSQKPNTVVFNFSHRKNVPDYIENDGLILGKRERPKVGDSGIILLPGCTDDSSTDFEGDEALLDPPSPCDIVFVGDNVLINGKSNLQKAPKRTKLHITFNEEAPTMFEYPSEASLLDDLTFDDTDVSSTSPGLNLPLRSSALASYTPSKVAIGSDFQLGVTRTQPPPPPISRPSDPLSSDEEDYLRPADDASTVAWSAETAADLLF